MSALRLPRLRRLFRHTRIKDAARARIEAARLGRDHGRRDFPCPPSPGGRVDDHVAEALHAEADAAAALAYGDHLAERRPDDDATIARAAGKVLRRTAETADARIEYTEALHRLATVEARSTILRWDRPWPPWLRVLLIGLMALGSMANLAAGLVGVTADDPVYALGYAVAIGAALVGLGAACGHMLKRWELNRLGPGEHVATRSRVPHAVVALGLVVAAGLAVAVASIRATAADAEAKRLAEAGSSAVEVVGGPAVETGAPGGRDAAVRRPDPTIDPVTWGALEAVLVVGSLLVEYAGSNPWARERGELGRQARQRRRRWRIRRKRLALAWTALRAACSVRADRDAAVLVTGEATLRHADVEAAIYRYENLAVRPRPDLGSGPDRREPMARFDPGHDVDLPVTNFVMRNWGDDLPAFETAAPQPDDQLRAVGGLAGILTDAQLELECQVVRPTIDPVGRQPDELLVDDHRARPTARSPGAPSGAVVDRSNGAARPELRPRRNAHGPDHSPTGRPIDNHGSNGVDGRNIDPPGAAGHHGPEGDS